MRRPVRSKESMFYESMAQLAILLSAMVGTIESVGLNITIQSPQTANQIQNLTFSEPMPLFDIPNQMYIRFDPTGSWVLNSRGADVGYSESTRASVSYGDVAESDYSVIDEHLAEYGVSSSFATSYAFLIKWTYASRTFESETLLATNGNQTFYLAWHPGASPATINRLGFEVYASGNSESYVPTNETIFVFQVESVNFTQLFVVPTTTTVPVTTTTSITSELPRNGTKISSSDNWMLLAALLFTNVLLFTL